jgi:hypothetical protein
MGDSATPQMGFTYWNVQATGGGGYNKAPMFTDEELYYTDRYVTDVITDNALGFLERNSGSSQPFSLNVHYTAPHAPWHKGQHPAELFDDYFENCAFDSVPDVPLHPNQVILRQHVGSTPELRREALSGYFAAISDWIGDSLSWAFILLATKVKAAGSIIGGLLAGTIRILGGIFSLNLGLILEGLWDIASGSLGAVFVYFPTLLGYLQTLTRTQARSRRLNQTEIAAVRRVYGDSIALKTSGLSSDSLVYSH